MKLSGQTTPWARQRLSDSDRVLIELAEPRDAVAALGYSRGWTCRITRDRQVVGESYEDATPRLAFQAALADMKAKAVA